MTSDCSACRRLFLVHARVYDVSYMFSLHMWTGAVRFPRLYMLQSSLHVSWSKDSDVVSFCFAGAGTAASFPGANAASV